MNKEQLIAAVRAHANANWGTAGWDFVVESWDDQDIADTIDDAVTVEEAIERCGEICRILEEQRQEVMSTIW
jgi:hypothetical protein